MKTIIILTILLALPLSWSVGQEGYINFYNVKYYESDSVIYELDTLLTDARFVSVHAYQKMKHRADSLEKRSKSYEYLAWICISRLFGYTGDYDSLLLKYNGELLPSRKDVVDSLDKELNKCMEYDYGFEHLYHWYRDSVTILNRQLNNLRDSVNAQMLPLTHITTIEEWNTKISPPIYLHKNLYWTLDMTETDIKSGGFLYGNPIYPEKRTDWDYLVIHMIHDSTITDTTRYVPE